MKKHYQLTLGSDYNDFVAEVTNDLGAVSILKVLTFTRDEMKFAYIAYVNFNISVIDAVALTLELKKK